VWLGHRGGIGCSTHLSRACRVARRNAARASACARNTDRLDPGTELVAAAGLEIGETGLLFATRTPPPGSKVDVVVDIETRRIRVRLTITRSGPIERDGVAWTLVAATYEGIAADDWDAIVRFCRDQAAPENRAAGELAALAASDDDAYRLLPLKVQQRVVEVLWQAGRLAAWEPTRARCCA